MADQIIIGAALGGAVGVLLTVIAILAWTRWTLRRNVRVLLGAFVNTVSVQVPTVRVTVVGTDERVTVSTRSMLDDMLHGATEPAPAPIPPPDFGDFTQGYRGPPVAEVPGGMGTDVRSQVDTCMAELREHYAELPHVKSTGWLVHFDEICDRHELSLVARQALKDECCLYLWFLIDNTWCE